MAIFQKAYKGYNGPITPLWERTFVIFRYALADVFRSRLFAGFFAICFLLPLALISGLYAYHNLVLLLQFQVDINDLDVIDGNAFAIMMQVPQLFLIFIMVMALGPAMISPDLRNNAMPLYLSRPINKASYIVGKLLVLVVLGSLISWIPAMLLVAIQGYLAGDGWLLENLHIPFAAFATSMVWIVCLSLIAFTISSFVQWKAVGRIAFFMVISMGSTVGEVFQDIFGGWGGQMLNVNAAMQTVLVELYQTESSQIGIRADMPLGPAMLALLLISAIAVIILSRRIRAYQVVS